MRKIFKFSLSLIIFLVIIILSLTVWLRSGPHSALYLAKIATSNIVEILPENSKFSISEVFVGLDKNYQIELTFDKIKFIASDKKEIILKNIKIFIDPLGIIPNSKYNLLNIKITEPRINLNQFKDESENNDLPIALINDYINSHQKSLLKFSLLFSNTELVYNNSNGRTTTIYINELLLKPIKNNNFLNFLITGNVVIGNKIHEIDATLDTTSNKHINFKGDVKNVFFSSFDALGRRISELEKANVTANLKFNGYLQSFKKLQFLEFDITNIKGEFQQNDFFPTTIRPSELDVQGYCNENCNEIFIDKFYLTTPELNFNGKFEIKPVGADDYLSGYFDIDKISFETVNNYWPESIIPKTKKSIFEILLNGFVSHTHGNINLNLDEILKRKNLDSSSLSIDLKIDDATINYLKGVPDIINAKGAISISKDDIIFKVDDANILDCSINAQGRVTNLRKEKSEIRISAGVEGSTNNIIDIAYAHDKDSKKDLPAVEGLAEASINVVIPIQDEDLKLKDLSLNIISKIKDIKVSNVYKDYSITSGNLNVTYNNHLMNINGQLIANDKIPVNLKVTQSILKDSKTIILNTDLDWSQLKDYNIKKPSFIDGSVILGLELSDNTGVKSHNINLDLTPSIINIENLAINKKAGTPAHLKFEFQDTDKHINVSNYELNLQNLKSKGNAVLSKDFSQIISINSPLTQLGKSNFKFNLKNENNSYNINLSGDSFDASQLMSKFNKGHGTKDNSEDDEKSSNFQIKAQLNKLFLKNGVELQDSSFVIKYDQNLFKVVKIQGNFSDNHSLNLDLHYPMLTLITNDTGQFLRGIGMGGKITGGDLNFHGKFDPENFSGIIQVNDYYMRKTPIMAKLLSVASITTVTFEGIATLFGNQGVRFEKLSCPITYKNGIVSLNECTMKGPVMLITGKGIINFNEDLVSINGMLVPQNFIDTILPNIPIIGKAFENGSAFGVNYAIEGSLEDPVTQANPLSILAPGFLKKIFQ